MPHSAFTPIYTHEEHALSYFAQAQKLLIGLVSLVAYCKLVDDANDFLFLLQGRSLPRGSADSDGLWVLGLMKNSAADAVGIEQGDQILEIDGNDVRGTSPFKAAVMMKGDESSNDLLSLKVC